MVSFFAYAAFLKEFFPIILLESGKSGNQQYQKGVFFPIIPLKSHKSGKQQYREGVFFTSILLKSRKSGN